MSFAAVLGVSRNAPPKEHFLGVSPNAPPKEHGSSLLSQESLVSGLFLPLGSETMCVFLDKAHALTSLSGRGSGFSLDDPRKEA